MLKKMYLVFLPFILSLFVVTQAEQSLLHLPRVHLIILVHPFNKLLTLPHTLAAIQQQDYPSERIRITIYTEQFNSVRNGNYDAHQTYLHSNWRTLQILRAWKNDVDYVFHSVNLEIQETNDIISDQQQQSNYWNDERFEKIIRLRTQALQHARQVWSDLVWFIDADVILTNASSLGELVRDNADNTVFAPMLLSRGSYSNFWGAMNEHGYYQRSEDYLDLVERKKIGVHQVPMVHTCFFIDLRKKDSDLLIFQPRLVGKNVSNDDVIAFGLSAKAHGVKMYMHNTIEHGYVMPPFDKQEDAHASIYNFLDLQLDYISLAGKMFPTTNSLEQYVQYIPHVNLGVDHVYVINLRRRPEKKRKMLAALRLLGLEAEIVNAVDGSMLSKSHLQQQQVNLMNNYLDPFHKRPMTFGEIGCFLSHYGVWQEVLHRNQSRVLVLEDDVRFKAFFRKNFEKLLQSIDSVQWDLVYLGRKRQDRAQEEQRISANLVKPSYSYWTIGYLLSNEGASKLINAQPLNNLLPVDEYLPIMYDKHPNDEWKAHFPERNIKAFSVEPLLIEPILYVGDVNYISDTENSEKLPDHHPKHSEL